MVTRIKYLAREVLIFFFLLKSFVFYFDDGFDRG